MTGELHLDALRAQLVGDNPERGFLFDNAYLPTAARRAHREATAGPLHDQD